MVKVSDNKLSWEKKKEKDRLLRKMTKDISSLEDEIAKTEEQIEIVNDKLSKPDEFSEEFKSGELFKLHDSLTDDLQKVYAKWEDFNIKLEELNKN